MKRIKLFVFLLGYFCVVGSLLGIDVTFAANTKSRIIVVSSYHREYLWSQDTNKGVCAALLKFKYLDNNEETQKFTLTDYVENSRSIIKKVWMDTKRKNSKGEIAMAVKRVIQEIDIFKPDIILLGDDNATNYIGNHYIDTNIPVVFWGVNGIPLKYGLLDSLHKPGHNVTGIYQAGYLEECVEYLKKLVPGLNSIAILSDDSPTGRSKAKELKKLARKGNLPMKLIETVLTNSYSEWKAKALNLQKNVDAFFVLNHNTLKDEQKRSVAQLEAGAWYLKNIKKPDCGHERQFVVEGVLCAVDDSGFNQGFEALKLAYQILEKDKNPAEISVYAPARGPFIVNRERAKMLGLESLIEKNTLIEEYIDKTLALQKYPQ